jgi:N-dimethylarginine dimethylaminohydrolase
VGVDRCHAPPFLASAVVDGISLAMPVGQETRLNLAGDLANRTERCFYTLRSRPWTRSGCGKGDAVSVWTEEGFEVVHQQFHGQAMPAFESDDMQTHVWGRRWGVFNDVGTLKVVLMHRPGDELNVVDERLRHPDVPALVDPEARWYFWGERAPDLAAMQRGHDALTQVLREHGVEIVWLDDPRPDDINAMFTRDMMVSLPGGAIVGRMGPLMRRGQELNVYRTLARIGMPVLRTVAGAGTFEGGGFALLDETHAVCAIGHRGNEEGARQVEEVLRPLGIELLRVPCRGWGCHIDGELVMVDHKTALIDPTHLPYGFLQQLDALGIRGVHVDPGEGAFAVNCLTLRPGLVVIAEGNERTRERLRKVGVDSIAIPYAENHKNGGGIHCSTMPLVRERD